MNLQKITNDINDSLREHQIGQIQSFRVINRKLSRPKSYNLFPETPIDPNWTFHIGGRKELQFNIGNEEEGLRFGFAFSFEPSISLPNPEILYPKARRLNYIIQSKPELFEDLKMWNWKAGERSKISNVIEIQEKDVCIHNFIFIGKIQSTYNLSEIMELFDRLYPIYQEVETTNQVKIQTKTDIKKFVFIKTEYHLPLTREINQVSKELNITVRHSLIQEQLLCKLFLEYGEENVTAEHYLNGNRIDVVVKDKEDIIFFEIKVANSAKDCIREALGQLFEYCFYPSNTNAQKLVVVGESEIDEVTQEYLEFLNTKINIPLEYRTVVLK